MRSTHLSMLVPIGIIVAICIIGLSTTKAQAGDIVVWKQIEGIREAGNEVGTGTPTDITGKVTGDIQPWMTTRKFGLDFARVNFRNGLVEFIVRNLVLAGGNDIGTRGSVTQVKGTLVCDTKGTKGDSVLVDTPFVPLSSRGNAIFRGLVEIPLPAACNESDIAFLIRTRDNVWIANGAIRVFK